jgi:hypothetical protein
MGSVSGSSGVGGVCGCASAYASASGSTSASITACYNTGSVSGSGNYVGGVRGSSAGPFSTITACYWKDISDDNATYGTGSSESNTGTSIFSIVEWPAIATDTEWGTGDGSGSGKYWKSLGDWNEGNPVYPKLFFED